MASSPVIEPRAPDEEFLAHEVAVRCVVDLELTDESVVAMEAWLAQDRKRENLPVHRYSAEDFGLTAEQIRDRFATYTDRFL